MLNHQRRLTLPRPTAAPTATQLRAVLTLHLLLLQAQDTNGLNALELYPEPHAPNAATKTTSWNMSGIEQYVVDFCAGTRGGDCHETVVFVGPSIPKSASRSVTASIL